MDSDRRRQAVARANERGASYDDPPSDAPCLPPTYTDVRELDRVFHVHCSICGAMWTGEWEHRPRMQNGRWVRLPKYEGGVLWYEAKDGTEYAYRCRCSAGERTPKLPAAPAWLWRHAQTRTGPQRVRYLDLVPSEVAA